MNLKETIKNIKKTNTSFFNLKKDDIIIHDIFKNNLNLKIHIKYDHEIILRDYFGLIIKKDIVLRGDGKFLYTKFPIYGYYIHIPLNIEEYKNYLGKNYSYLFKLR